MPKTGWTTQAGWRFCAALALLLCGGGLASAGTKPAVPPGQDGYDLALAATACWFGGVWSDAKNVPAAEVKEADDKRCAAVVRRIYGSEDHTRWEQLRALEVQAVEDLVVKVGGLAAANPAEAPHRDALTKLVRLVAAAQREGMYARRAADRVKLDIAKTREPGNLSPDEVAAAPALQAHEALQKLLAFDVAPYAHDGRAIGVMLAMDRMEIARGLPKHLKVYAVSGAYALLFAVKPPIVPSDATKPLQGGQWLS